MIAGLCAVLLSGAVAALSATPAQAMYGGTSVTAGSALAVPFSFVTQVFQHNSYDLAAGADPAIGSCTGTLITPTWVLTANHCTSNAAGLLAAGNMSVRVGNTVRYTGPGSGADGQVSNVIKILRYTNATVNYSDVALLELSTRITGITPATLAPPTETSRWDGPTDLAQVVGWGLFNQATSTNDLPTYKQQKLIAVNSRTVLSSGPASLISTAAGLCSGDSGGPLLVPIGAQSVLAGVASTGDGAAACAPSVGGPSKWSDVGSGPVHDWIVTTTGRLDPDWTNIVPTGRATNATDTDNAQGRYGVHDVLFYRQGSGIAVTGHFDSAGNYYQMSMTPGLATTWTHIVGTLSYRKNPTDSLNYVSDQLFYDKATGAAAYTYLEERGVGTLHACPAGPNQPANLAAGWSQIVPWRSSGAVGKVDKLLFYNDQSGQLVTGTWGNCRYIYDQTQWIDPGFTSITVTADDRVLLYNKSTGTGLTGHFTSSFGATPTFHATPTFQADRPYTGAQGFATGWTHIFGDVDGHMLFFHAYQPSGLLRSSATTTFPGASGVLAADGTFTTTQGFSFKGFTDMVGWPAAPHIVFFYNRETGQAETGYLPTPPASTPTGAGGAAGYAKLQSWS